MDGVVAWLSGHWVIGAGFMAAAGFASLPLLASLVSWPVLLILLCSPVYMLHQVEEHHHDRFRQFVNDALFGGRCAMTRRDVLIVNVPVVWGLDLAAAYAAVFVTPAAGLIAAARLRGYNPGLLSAVLMFVPLGTAVVVAEGSLPSAAPSWHAAALGGALAIHATIAGSAIRRPKQNASQMG